MKQQVLGVLGGVALLLAAAPVAAHHSFAAEFDIEKPIELKGTLTKMAWVNPHGWIYIDVKNPDGTITNWAIEAGATAGLLRNGLRKTDFPVGSEVVVKGFRAKTGKAVANARSVTLPDGRNFYASAGDSPGAPVNVSAAASGSCDSASLGDSPRAGRVNVPLTTTRRCSAPALSKATV